MAVSYIRIGKNIAAERNKAGMTQEVLAEHLGLSTSHLSNIERAQRKANLSMLVEICTVLDISLERLFRGAVGNVAIYGDETPSDDDMHIKQQIMKIIDECNPKTRKRILDMCIVMTDLENPD